MNRLFQKPPNISYSYIEDQVNSRSVSDLTLFKYIYLLAKKYAIDNRLPTITNSRLNLFAIKCASITFEILKEDSNLNYLQVFDKIYKDILDTIDVKQEVESSNNTFLFNNFLIDKFKSATFNGSSDVSSFSTYIRNFLHKLPKRLNSSENSNLSISVLLSFYKTISYYKEAIVDYNETIYPKVILYNLDVLYKSYIETLVLELVYNLRDNLNRVLSSKKDNVFTLHFKDLLRNE